jgi:DNA polymerase (family 10)
VAVEINANPYRLELDWRWHERALALGCLLSINPDAHSIAELDFMKWGVAVARKGGVPKDKVLNAMNLDQVLAHLRKRHQRIGRSHRPGGNPRETGRCPHHGNQGLD